MHPGTDDDEDDIDRIEPNKAIFSVISWPYLFPLL